MRHARVSPIRPADGPAHQFNALETFFRARVEHLSQRQFRKNRAHHSKSDHRLRPMILAIGADAFLGLQLRLRNPVLMAVRAFHPVDVVLAVRRPEGGVHLLHVQPAIRHLGMAGCAGRSGLLAVLRMAGQATDAFVHADPVSGRRRWPPAWWQPGRGTGSTAPGAGPGSSSRCESPSSIAGKGRSATGMYCCVRRSKNASDGRAISCDGPGTRPSRRPSSAGGPSRCISVAGQAGHGRACGQIRLHQAPRPVRFDRRHQIADAALEVHAVAAQAIVHQHVCVLCFLSRKMRA